ncbi:hypothetical protein LOTGIDRAFT_237439 [Lottia gigantea]|uniref:RING-type E3 ubiquitin transferase n=1 Tax=Lottia gigantea TaxID=225164 RepID=V4BEM3_LOTGI|nr:hypothetical protein LOTGIDRAFT_237439 [Lottia gigantea]ESP04252.1 hypothetical protein LOTGIDRAFT_237439 [Lottia gigantea]
MFKAAGTPEILRSHQKDDYYLTYLRTSIAETFQLLAGARKWIKWRRELDVMSDLGYFLLTTLSGNQTIGEEYVNIVQVDSTRRHIPSLPRRALMALLHVVSPYILQKVLKNLETTLQTAPHRAEETEKMLKALRALQQCLIYLHRLHLGIFYLRGVFYHIAKRITGVHYIKYMGNKSPSSDVSSVTFKYLAWLSLGQITFSAFIQLYHYYQSTMGSSIYKTHAFGSTTEKKRMGLIYRKCSLCLEGIQSPTLAPCGHLFCWNCIHTWCQNKSECPMCRDKFQPHRLVFLKNL